MDIKNLIFYEKSETGKYFFLNMLKLLDNPARQRYNNPQKLLKPSGIHYGQTVLEIGCGSGYFTVPAAKLLGSEGKLYSIDIHPIAVEETQRKVNEAKLTNVIVQQDDAIKSSFADSMFDLVLLYGVIPSPVISIKDISLEINRVLKPGGVCAIWTIVPFWTPRSFLKIASFTETIRLNGVFAIQKNKD